MPDAMKPILILPPDSMSAEDIEKLNANGICTVVCINPAAVKFLDPIPSAAGRGKVEQAAIGLSRKLLNWQWIGNSNLNADYRLDRKDICQLYMDVLMRGTPLSAEPTPEEIQASRQRELEHTAHLAKLDEIRRIAREEARAEREAKKAEKKAADQADQATKDKKK
jgi:hypothetical protein